MAAVSILAILVPVYTYEHHLVWAIPAIVLCVMALLDGAIGMRWGLPIGLSMAMLAYPHLDLNQMSCLMSLNTF